MLDIQQKFIKYNGSIYKIVDLDNISKNELQEIILNTKEIKT